MIGVNAYGDKNGNDKGIVCFDFDEGILHKRMTLLMEGKANASVKKGSRLWVSVQKAKGNYLEEYDVERGIRKRVVQTDLFYSYLRIKENHLLAASYESGTDEVYDLRSLQRIATSSHYDGNGEHGRSHYIGYMPDGKLISIDNGTQQIYRYKDISLSVDVIKAFPSTNIRLLSVHPNKNYLYLNSEKTNELIVLSSENLNVIWRQAICSNASFISAGNAVSEDGRYLCISMRGENMLYFYSLDDEGMPHELCKISCGKMPRDVMFVGEYLLVTCTQANHVEVYKLKNGRPTHISTVWLNNPVTFMIEEN